MAQHSSLVSVNSSGAVLLCEDSSPPGQPSHAERCSLQAGMGGRLPLLTMDSAVLWFNHKQMLPDRKLSDYVGKNEKTKVWGVQLKALCESMMQWLCPRCCNHSIIKLTVHVSSVETR